MNKRSLWIFASAALLVAAGLAGCGKTTYFAGRTLPPSGLSYRVLIAIQNPSAFTKGELQIVDAFYDIRSGYTGQPASFSLSGFGGAFPISIQSMPEEQIGAVYGSGDGSLTLASYQTEKTSGTVAGLNGLSASIYATRNGSYVFAASQSAHVLLGCQPVERLFVSAQPSRCVSRQREPRRHHGLAFVQNSNYAYYPRQLDRRAVALLFRRPIHLAQGRGRLRTAKCSRLVPLPGAES